MVTVRTALITLAALGCALGAAVAIRRQPRERRVVTLAEPTLDVVVATVDIPRGHRLRSDQLRSQPWPSRFVPPEALRSSAQAEGRTVLQPLVAGELLLERKLAPIGALANLAAHSPLVTSEREQPLESAPVQPLKLMLLRGSQVTILQVPP
ncbi:MAG: SAF domain-containing protein [Planctomycetota bacterium]